MLITPEADSPYLVPGRPSSVIHLRDNKASGWILSRGNIEKKAKHDSNRTEMPPGGIRKWDQIWCSLWVLKKSKPESTIELLIKLQDILVAGFLWYIWGLSKCARLFRCHIWNKILTTKFEPDRIVFSVTVAAVHARYTTYTIRVFFFKRNKLVTAKSWFDQVYVKKFLLQSSAVRYLPCWFRN